MNENSLLWTYRTAESTNQFAVNDFLEQLFEETECEPHRMTVVLDNHRSHDANLTQ